MAKECKGCVYWRSISFTDSNYACHYMLDTGKPRNGPTGANCPRRKERPRRSGNSRRGKEKKFIFSVAESEEMSRWKK